MAAPSDPTENIRISDPRALKALAHPARNKILERLQVYGPATATDCAAVAGMSPSACSYHLRMLERYGFGHAARTLAAGRFRGEKSLADSRAPGVTG